MTSIILAFTGITSSLTVSFSHKVEWYLQRALEIYTNELGPDDPTVSRTMSLLVSYMLDHLTSHDVRWCISV